MATFNLPIGTKSSVQVLWYEKFVADRVALGCSAGTLEKFSGRLISLFRYEKFGTKSSRYEKCGNRSM